MPEEIGIAIVVIVVVLWIFVKVFQAAGRRISAASEHVSNTISRNKTARFLQTKQKLSLYTSVTLPNQLEAARGTLELAKAALKVARETKWIAQRPLWVHTEFKPFVFPPRSESYREMRTNDLPAILTASLEPWSEQERKLISQNCAYPHVRPTTPAFEFKPVGFVRIQLDEARFKHDPAKISERKLRTFFQEEFGMVSAYNQRRADLLKETNALNDDTKEWNEHSRRSWELYVGESKKLAEEELAKYKCVSDTYSSQCREQKETFATILEAFNNGIKDGVLARTHCILNSIRLPQSVPRTWEIDFDDEERILVVDIGLPDVVHHAISKTVDLKKGPVLKPLSQKERKEFVPGIHPAILLRVAYEVFRNDPQNVIRLLVVNGWVKFDDPSTGVNTKAYTASLMVEKDKVLALNLSKVDPLSAFESLQGKSAGKLVEIIPIEPTLSLNRKDSRFVDAKAVLNTLGESTNLAAMDWQDFEHLIRELFEKVFAGRGAEVKITQASRDRGVDAIVFDPDPIHGGKFVIQAKRYTNTVDVSAVRDLCAVVTKEGASRGIMVTTSTYGADAYAFANNSPVTLLNGAELLGLLNKHGYKFRIDLREARSLIAQGVLKR